MTLTGNCISDFTLVGMSRGKIFALLNVTIFDVFKPKLPTDTTSPMAEMELVDIGHKGIPKTETHRRNAAEGLRRWWAKKKENENE
jgi:hypothetical protein